MTQSAQHETLLVIRRRSTFVFGLAIVALAATFVFPALAVPAADDVVLSVSLHDGATTTPPNFELHVLAESTSSVEQAVTIRIGLPDRLRWGGNAPDPGEGCTGIAPATCTTRMRPNEVGTLLASYHWDVIASQPGFYEVTASLTTSEPDPDLSNNTKTLRFEVVPTGGGESGGAGGSGGGGTAAATASAVKLSPARPKAGSTVVASVRVTRGGSPVRPTGVTCAATLGKVKVRGGARASSGVASCLFKTPKNGKGKSLVGSVSFRAGGTSFTKRFATKLR